MRAVSVGRINSVLFLGFLIFSALYFAREFFIPFTIGILLSMLMLPVCKKLESWGINRGFSIFICILTILLVVAGLVGLLSAQVVSFREDIPQVRSKIEQQLPRIQSWIQAKYHISPEEQMAMIKDSSGSATKAAGTFFTKLIGGTLGGLTNLLLILVYVFFFLYYREKYENFLLKIRGENERQEVKQLIGDITQVAVQYIGGRVMAIVILAVLNSVGLLILGIKYAILLGTIAAVFTFIPYVGTLIGGVFAAVTALLTKSPGAALAVIALLAFIQLLDDYLIEPYVVGAKVHLGPLAIIVVLVIGGLIWGVAGMILFIPLLSIAKIIFDYVPSLQPYGYLVGDEENNSGESVIDKIKGWFGRNKQ